MRSLLIAFILAFHAMAGAEILTDIHYNESLRYIKDKFPNAAIENINAAWLKSNERFIKISGRGLGKAIRVKLTDRRPQVRKNIIDDAAHLDESSRSLLVEINKLPDDDVFLVEWVRVTPDFTSSLDKYISVFGAPDCRLNFDMEMDCTWEDRNMTAQVTDDKKTVLSTSIRFTPQAKSEGIEKSLQTNNGHRGLIHLSGLIYTQINNTKKWFATVEVFIAKNANEIDYKADKLKFSDFDKFVKLLANRKENSDKSAEWFLSEAHKMVKRAHGIN